jgi:hypothetical protein
MHVTDVRKIASVERLLMTSDKASQGIPLKELTAAIDSTLDLLSEFHPVEKQPVVLAQSPASLLEQCLTLCSQYVSVRPEPIRTVHHFACTGGTLLCKCLAALPNTQVLSEVDPLSTLIDQPQPRFAPSDMITLMRQSTRGASSQLLIDLFLDNLEVIYRDVHHKGLHLILRDHAHSHYCIGAGVIDRPSFREMIITRFPVLSVVTVRHPLDSYLALRTHGWISLEPPTFDEYCKRYLAFLQAHEAVPKFMYEDFIADPRQAMNRLSQALELAFSEDFIDLFSVFRLSGDSGRGGDLIEQRPRRPLEGQILAEIANAPHYQRLLGILEYTP